MIAFRALLNGILSAVRPSIIAATATLAVVGAAGATPASAAAPASHLTLHLLALPTHFSAADNARCERELGEIVVPCDGYQVTATDSGALTAAGPVTLTDTVPAGLKVVEVTFDRVRNRLHGNLKAQSEPGTGEPLSSEELCRTEGRTVSCSFPLEVGELHPDQRLRMYVRTTVGEGAESGEPDTATVSEAGAPVASTSIDDVIGSTAPPFGASALLADITGADGASDTQAGDHPYEFTTRIDLHTRMGLNAENNFEPTSAGESRDVVVDLPVGFLGSALATPTCTFGELQGRNTTCPLDTLVGHLATEPFGGETDVNGPVYNMVAEPGVAAEFAFKDSLAATHVILASIVPTPSGYVLRATARELPEIGLTSVISTFYGDPAAKQEEIAKLEGQPVSSVTPAAMFTNSSDCSGRPRPSTLFMDSWEHPGPFAGNGTPAGEPQVEGENWVPTESAPSESPPVTGCDMLRFSPAFTFNPEPAHAGADEPAGYESVTSLPQSETPGTLATPPLKTAVVTLPAGVSISPSAANGLGSCPATGAEGINFSSASAGDCPPSSKIGTVEVTTPLLEEPLTGGVFVAQPACGGSGQPACTEQDAEEGGLFAIYLEVGNENRGVHLKLRGRIEVGGEGHRNGLAPGQVRTSFIETPQFPFSRLKLEFNGGPRAPLANPQGCGTYTTNASLEPWSAPESGPPALEQPSFNITGCENAFAPAFLAGTVSSQAAAFSAFTLTFSRHDREQDLSGLTVNMPDGLLGKIAGIPQCPEADANAGTCAATTPGSRIGTASAAAGSGTVPLWQSGGVYLTGPYNNGPFGLSVVVPANAGPYHLGNIVVRASIRIDPSTAQVSVVSNPLPQAVDGVPLRVKTVNVTVGEAGNFTFNPTNCTPATINATITSAQGTAVPVSSPFNATGCATLPFHPEFSASTSGKTSKANGASFHVRIGFPTGGQANIHKVELTIPSVLPSRLTTLQKACPEAVFNANPATCPSASLIATAVAHTPLLPDPLVGPVYFVSHGGAAFPDTVMVLQGDNVKLEVVGHTDIKNDVTYSRFETVPDAPVTSFEFNAPEGPYSIFGAYGVLCQKEIKAPTTITAQNGAVFSQNTLVEVQGCPNKLTILSHTVKKRTITLKVAVPSAGKLTATGRGLSKTTKTTAGRGTVTLTLKAKGNGKLKTKVKLTFAPTKGKHLSASVSAKFKK